MEKQLASVEKICHEVESLSRLESVVKLNDKWMRNLLHDVSLNLCILDLIVLDDKIFLECLHRIDFSIILFLGHVDFPERPSSNDFEELEVFHSHHGCLLAEEVCIVVSRIAIHALIAGGDRGIDISISLCRVLLHHVR